jgi:hypothetical protein
MTFTALDRQSGAAGRDGGASTSGERTGGKNNRQPKLRRRHGFSTFVTLL